LPAVAAAQHKIVGLTAREIMLLQQIMEDLADLVQKQVEQPVMVVIVVQDAEAQALVGTVQQVADLLRARWRNLFLMVEEAAEMQEAGAALKFMVALEVVEVVAV
jgi:hypothetical protein